MLLNVNIKSRINYLVFHSQYKHLLSFTIIIHYGKIILKLAKSGNKFKQKRKNLLIFKKNAKV